MASSQEQLLYNPLQIAYRPFSEDATSVLYATPPTDSTTDSTNPIPQAPAVDYDAFMRKQGRRWDQDLLPDETERLEKAERDERNALVAEIALNATITIICANNKRIENVPVADLAKLSDVILTSHTNKQFAASSTLHLEDYEVDVLNLFVRYDTQAANINGENIVPLTKLSHYLQASDVFADCTEILSANITPSNATSMLHLSEQLNHRKLFEDATSCLLQQTVELEASEGWLAMDRGIRDKVTTLRNLARSSILGRGAKVSELIFTSGAEFVGLLEESILEQSERLADAKQRQQEMRDDQAPSSRNLEYADEKIKKQETRIETLKAYLQSQQDVFTRQEKGS